MRIAEPRGPGSTLPALPVSPCLDRGAGLTTANQSRTCSPLDHFEPFWTLPLTSRPLPTRVWHTPVSIAVAGRPSVTTAYDICHRTEYSALYRFLPHNVCLRSVLGPPRKSQIRTWPYPRTLITWPTIFWKSWMPPGRYNFPTHAAQASGLPESHLA